MHQGSVNNLTTCQNWKKWIFSHICFEIHGLREGQYLPQNLPDGKFWRIRVPTRDSFSSRNLKVCNLSQVEARYRKLKIVLSRSTNNSPVRTQSNIPKIWSNLNYSRFNDLICYMSLNLLSDLLCVWHLAYWRISNQDPNLLIFERISDQDRNLPIFNLHVYQFILKIEVHSSFYFQHFLYMLPRVVH